jgi:hypothetical protein
MQASALDIVTIITKHINLYSMEKRFLRQLVLAVFLHTAHAQATASSTQIDEIFFNGYRIVLHQLPPGGFIYDIISAQGTVIHQDKNPFTGSPDGLKIREDAVKTAKWQIIHINPINKKPLMDKQLLPVEVARQLKIETN